jgi:hypothetical protein
VVKYTHGVSQGDFLMNIKIKACNHVVPVFTIKGGKLTPLGVGWIA